MSSVIKCLSIRPPYADWIVNLQKFQEGMKPKTIENREWSTEYRGPLLIHSSNTFESNAIDYWFIELPWLSTIWSEQKKDYHRGMIVGIADLTSIVTDSDDPWFVGTYGWVLANARAFKNPIPYKGSLGLFNVPLSVVVSEMEASNGG